MFVMADDSEQKWWKMWLLGLLNIRTIWLLVRTLNSKRKCDTNHFLGQAKDCVNVLRRCVLFTKRGGSFPPAEQTFPVCKELIVRTYDTSSSCAHVTLISKVPFHSPAYVNLQLSLHDVITISPMVMSNLRMFFLAHCLPFMTFIAFNATIYQ